MFERIILPAIPMCGYSPAQKSRWERWLTESFAGCVQKRTGILISSISGGIWPRKMPIDGCLQCYVCPWTRLILACLVSTTAKRLLRKARSFRTDKQCILSQVSLHPFLLKKFGKRTFREDENRTKMASFLRGGKPHDFKTRKLLQDKDFPRNEVFLFR